MRSPRTGSGKDRASQPSGGDCAGLQVRDWPTLEKRLRRLGFEDDTESFLLVKSYMLLNDLCTVLDCRPTDFKAPMSPGYPGLPPMNFNAPNCFILRREQYLCKIWFLDPDQFPKNLGEAEIQVGFSQLGAGISGVEFMPSRE